MLIMLLTTINTWSFSFLLSPASLQGSFVAPRGQANRNGDIEMATQRTVHSGELGLQNFFEKVAKTWH